MATQEERLRWEADDIRMVVSSDPEALQQEVKTILKSKTSEKRP